MILSVTEKALMLTLLKIQNLALIDHLVWEPGPKLTGITGETGAGKSVIIGALRLVLGERADKGVIRSGESTTTVEALFELADASHINLLLEESGLPACEDNQLIIKRIVTQTGNKQFINNSPATLGLLRDIGGHLVDLHSPGDQQTLLSPERQGDMLDLHGGLQPLKKQYQTAWKAWQEVSHTYNDLLSSEKASEAEIALLTHLVTEIEEANIQPDEESDLEDRWRRSQNASKLLETAAKAIQILNGEQISLLSQTMELQRCTHDLERMDPSLAEVLAPLASITSELQELEGQLSDYVEQLDLDPAEYAALEERINLLENLKRKYGHSLEEIMERYDTAKNRLNNIENRSELLEELSHKMTQAREQLESAGKSLTQARAQAAPVLAEQIKKQLGDLGFQQSAFAINLIPHAEPHVSGLEQIEFLISPNPGEPLKALRQIASSGELARIMLAVKTALARQDSTPLLVFDEIDANVGGEIARAVGEKMAALGEQHQVISITHFPQVAALSHNHFLVSKTVKEGRTLSSIIEIEGEPRVQELVRMLGGGGDSAVAHARALLGQ